MKRKASAVPVTIFSSGTATQGTEQRATLIDIAQYLDREYGPRYPDDKDADDAEKKRQPLLKLGRFENQSRRRGSTVLDHGGLALDYDDPETSMAEAAERLEQAGIAALLYPTWKGLPRYRVLVIFNGPLPEDADLEHAAKPVTGLIGPASKESFDPARGFFIGRPKGEKREPIVIEGECMAPEYVPVGVKERPKGNGGERILHGERNTRLAAIAGALRRQHCDEEAIYAALAAVNAEQCDPPLEESEVRAIARSIAGYAPGEAAPHRSHFKTPTPAGFEAVFGKERPAPPPVLIDGLFPCDAFGMVGTGGTMKTSLMQWIMVHVILARAIKGRQVFRPGPTLIVSAEDDAQVLRYRLREIGDALGLTRAEREQVAAHFHIEDVTGNLIRFVEADQRGNLVITPHIDDLIAAYDGVRPKLVAFDPAIYFGPGERYVNDAEAALMQVARRCSRAWGCAAGYLQHVSKTAANEKDVGQHAGRGGSAFADNSRAILAMTRHEKDVKEYPRPETVTQQDVDEDRTVRLHVAKFSAGKREPRALWIVRGAENPWQFTLHDGVPNTRSARREHSNEVRDRRMFAALLAVVGQVEVMRLKKPDDYPSKEAIVGALIGTDTGRGGGVFGRSMLRDAVALAESQGALMRVEHKAPGRTHGYDADPAHKVGVR